KEDAYFTSLRDALPPELEERDREILIAYYEEQAGYEELSKRLGIPVERCRVWVFRAKNRCRKLLEAKKIFPAEEIKAPAETIKETGGDPDASR
ncbi:sigma factor-like helix-turn-helix DNA-binding protein, partial [uncultured Oscillibacter sp.]|uniref:sigma factor-like helix-turn-helix DNA-binding protein n=1 Tax=uncultured Oscillibacter sp. TaxID=876091 RepID=UPI00261E4B73